MIINLYGGPGTGKSTIAAAVFSKLKLQGINAELVTEFAKDLTWEERFKTLQNQNYVTAKQHHRLWRVKDVNAVVTDSPLLLGLVYCDQYEEHTKQLYQEFDNLDIFLNRKKEYKTEGRSQTLDEAIVIDNKIKAMLNKYYIPVVYIDGDESAINSIVTIINGLGVR